jgi:hypothetical protein
MRDNSTSKGANVSSWRHFVMQVGTVLLIVLMSCSSSSAYSVLTHEEIVDLLWSDEIRPLLLKRYPGLTEDQIREAHAYAYGGAVIQDLGYYPFGSREFSDLVHYVRSGDFVRELLIESQDVNEYAFALGPYRTMRQTSLATRLSISLSPSNIRSCGRSMASRFGTRRTRPHI